MSIDTAPARSATRDLAQIAVFAALIVVLGLPGQLTIGSAGVPITLQTLGAVSYTHLTLPTNREV